MKDLLVNFNIQEIFVESITWIQTKVLVFTNLLQLIAIILTGLCAQYLYTIINKKLVGYESVFTKNRSKHKFLSAISPALRHILFPLIWLALLATIAIAYSLLEQPYPIVRTAIYLILAWTVIRLGSYFIDNPFSRNVVATIVWVITALSILGILQPTIRYLESASLSLGRIEINAFVVISSILSIGFFLWIALIVIRIFENRLSASLSVDPSLKVLFIKLFKFIVITVAILGGLSAVGIDLTVLAVFGGAVGVGIGFGLQRIFSNLIAGIILLIDKSIKPGDTIEVKGTYGKVDKLGARYVSVITRDGIEHLIPNEELIINRVENWSYSHELVRLKIPVGVHYKSNINQAIEICVASAQNIERVLNDPKPACLLKEFDESSVNLEIRIWIRDPMNGCSNVKSQVLLEVWNQFAENGIEIPYPQRDVHIKNFPGELKDSTT